MGESKDSLDSDWIKPLTGRDIDGMPLCDRTQGPKIVGKGPDKPGRFRVEGGRGEFVLLNSTSRGEKAELKFT